MSGNGQRDIPRSRTSHLMTDRNAYLEVACRSIEQELRAAIGQGVVHGRILVAAETDSPCRFDQLALTANQRARTLDYLQRLGVLR